MKKSGKFWLVSISIFLFLILGIILYFAVNQSFQPSGKTFTQYTGMPSCNGGTCGDWTKKILTSSIAEFQVGTNAFKFESSVNSLCGSPNYPNVVRGCCETVKVIKDGVEIDQLHNGYAGSKPDGTGFQFPENTERVKVYSADDGKNKIQINMNNARWFYVDSCYSIENAYSLIFPEDSFDVEILPVNKVFRVGDNISIPIQIQNNFQDVAGKLTVKYRVSTVIGDYEKSESQMIDIPLGLNSYEVKVPSGQATANLNIQPSLEFFVSTSDIKGVNYPIQGTLYSIGSSPNISLGSTSGNITIISIEQNETIGTEICNNDIDDDKDGLIDEECNINPPKKFNWMLWAGLGVLAIFIIFIIILALRRKR